MTRRDLFNATMGVAPPVQDNYLSPYDNTWQGDPSSDPGATQANQDDRMLAYTTQLRDLSHQAEMAGQANDAQHKIAVLKQALSNPYSINTSQVPGSFGYSANTGFPIGYGMASPGGGGYQQSPFAGIIGAPYVLPAHGPFGGATGYPNGSGYYPQPDVGQSQSAPITAGAVPVQATPRAFGAPGGQGNQSGIPFGQLFQPASQQQSLDALHNLLNRGAYGAYSPMQNQADVQNILQADTNARNRGFSLGWQQQQKNEADAQRQAQQNFRNNLAGQQQANANARYAAQQGAGGRQSLGNVAKNNIAQENVDQRAARYASQDQSQDEKDANSRLEAGVSLDQILAGFPQLAKNPIALQRLTSYAGTIQDQNQSQYDLARGAGQNYNSQIQDAADKATKDYNDSLSHWYGNSTSDPKVLANNIATSRNPILQDLAKSKQYAGVLKYDPELNSVAMVQPNPIGQPLVNPDFKQRILSQQLGGYGAQQVLNRYSPQAQQPRQQSFQTPAELLPRVLNESDLSMIPAGEYYQDQWGQRRQNIPEMFPNSDFQSPDTYSDASPDWR